MSDLNECHQVREMLPELAAGALAGDERAVALRHVGTCPACRRELDAFAEAADALLLPAPSVEPPPGFENDTLTRIRGMSATTAVPALRVPRRNRVARALAFATAIVMAVAAGISFNQWQMMDDRRIAEQYRNTLAIAGGRYLKAATITTADAQPIGTVFFYEGKPSWILIAISAAPADGRFEILVVDEHGATHAVGYCQVADGKTVTGYRLDLAVAHIRQVRIQSPDTVLTATA